MTIKRTAKKAAKKAVKSAKKKSLPLRPEQLTDEACDLLIFGVTLDNKTPWVARKTHEMIKACQEDYAECLALLKPFSQYEDFERYDEEERWAEVTSKSYVKENIYVPKERAFEDAEADCKALTHHLECLEKHTEAFRAGKFYCAQEIFENAYENTYRYFATKRELAEFLLPHASISKVKKNPGKAR